MASGGAALGFEDWTGGRELATIGTNTGAAVLPFQRWRPFKEAFAPELVERAINETPGDVRHIVDPFGGSGTTALAAQFLGIRPTTIEVNPFLADLIEAKIGKIDLDRAPLDLRAVVEMAANAKPPKPTFSGAPSTFVEPGREGRWIFSRDVASRILAYRNAIASVGDAAIKKLMLVTLAAVLVPVSNVTISGKGRRYRSGWERRQVSPNTVDQLFREGMAQSLYDLRRYGARRCREYVLLRGDARDLASCVGAHDLAVFSPPYPNSFDYTDVYNVELWAMGYFSDQAENLRLRHATMRSHVQIFRDMNSPGLQSPLLDITVAALVDARQRLWNRHIPEMIGAYMADILAVLKGLHLNLRPNGRIYMVVGDSRYATVDVPVGAILAELAPSCGFEVVRAEPCRSMRASPQQGGRHELAESLITLGRT